MTAMRFNISLPIDQIEPKGEFQNFDVLRTVSLAIEASGAAAAGLTEHPAPDANWLHNDLAGHDTLDPFTALAFVAAVTTRLKVMTQIVVLPYRNPFLSAKAAATLQILSGDRFIFGVGAGYQRGEFEALGVPMNKRGVLTDEALETIHLAWAGGAVVKKGMFFDARGNEPRPVPSTPPPIWLGGGSDKAIERAARWGDGWIPFLTQPFYGDELTEGAIMSIEHLGEKIALLAERRAHHGRSAPADVCLPIPFALEGRTSAEAEKLRDFIGQLGDVGVTWISMGLPHVSVADFQDNVQWFGEEVIARFDTGVRG